MAKFYGKIGYAETTQTAPGVWDTEHIVEHTYTGDVIRNARRYEQNPESTNQNLNVNNSISIVADAYANNHFFAMRYVEWMGVRWQITNVEVQRPRLILTIGGVYNGATPED